MPTRLEQVLKAGKASDEARGGAAQPLAAHVFAGDLKLNVHTDNEKHPPRRAKAVPTRDRYDRYDDYDDYDEPKSGGGVTRTVVIAIVALLLLGGGGFAIWWLFLRGGSSNGGESAMANLTVGELCGGDIGDDSACRSGACRLWNFREERCCPESTEDRPQNDGAKCLFLPLGSPCHGLNHIDQCEAPLMCNHTEEGICQPKFEPGQICGGDTGDDDICASGSCRLWDLHEERCCPYSNQEAGLGQNDPAKCLHLPEGSPCHGLNHLDQCGTNPDGVKLICNDTNSGICQVPLAEGEPCGGDVGDDAVCASGKCRLWDIEQERCCPEETNEYPQNDPAKCLHLPEGAQCHGLNHADQCKAPLICPDTNKGLCRPKLSEGEHCGGDIGDDAVCQSGFCRLGSFFQEVCCPPNTEGATQWDVAKCLHLPLGSPCHGLDHDDQCGYDNGLKLICNDTNDGRCRHKLKVGEKCGGDMGDDEICETGMCRHWEGNQERCCPADNQWPLGNDCRNLEVGNPCFKNAQCQTDICYQDLDAATITCTEKLEVGQRCDNFGANQDDNLCESGYCRQHQANIERCCPADGQDAAGNDCKNLPIGNGCFKTEQCADSWCDLYDANSANYAKCTAYKQVGEACEHDDTCIGANGGSGVCRQYEANVEKCCPADGQDLAGNDCKNLAAGSGCFKTEQCTGGWCDLYDANSANYAKCTAYKQVGEACEHDDTCVGANGGSGVCRQHEANVEKCCPTDGQDIAGNDCKNLPAGSGCFKTEQCSGGWCDLYDANSANYAKCTAYKQVGEACEHDDTCIGANGASGVCRQHEANVEKCCPTDGQDLAGNDCKNLPAGSGCFKTEQCLNGWCNLEGNAGADYAKCAALIAVGETCIWDSSCSSGYCRQYGANDERCCPQDGQDWTGNDCKQLSDDANCFKDEQCISSWCENNKCKPKGNQGDECIHDWHCSNGMCRKWDDRTGKEYCCPTDGNDPGAWTNDCFNLDINAECHNNNQCKSGLCGNKYISTGLPRCETAPSNWGSHCWDECGQVAGSCSFCGGNGACCRSSYASDPSDSCGSDHLTDYVSVHDHKCVEKTGPSSLRSGVTYLPGFAPSPPPPDAVFQDMVAGYCDYRVEEDVCEKHAHSRNLSFRVITSVDYPRACFYMPTSFSYVYNHFSSIKSIVADEVGYPGPNCTSSRFAGGCYCSRFMPPPPPPSPFEGPKPPPPPSPAPLPPPVTTPPPPHPPFMPVSEIDWSIIFGAVRRKLFG